MKRKDKLSYCAALRKHEFFDAVIMPESAIVSKYLSLNSYLIKLSDNNNCRLDVKLSRTPIGIFPWWARSHLRGPEAEPLVRGSESKPPEAHESIYTPKRRPKPLLSIHQYRLNMSPGRSARRCLSVYSLQRGASVRLAHAYGRPCESFESLCIF